MRCPYCQGVDDKVVDSRLAEDGAAIRRRRECLVCSRRYTTYERIDEVPLVVVKRSGTSEPFDRDKLAAGIERAVTGRPIEEGTVAALAAEVEEEARGESAEVTSERLGLALLERLRRLDDVAYLRFASVYKGFENLDDFEREVGELQKTTAPKRR
ncbi:MAG: transcriptional regulator NrdR [Actinomycetota bacterium]